MDLVPYTVRLQRDLGVAAESGDDDVRAVAERLAGALESSLRLVLLDVLVEAAGEITGTLAPGTVEVRLRGPEVGFAVTPADASDPLPPPVPPAAVHDGLDGPGEGGTARLSLRMPERLKPRVEQAADAAGLSVNAWLVRSISSLVETPAGPPPPAAPGFDAGNRRTGWVR